MQLIPNQSIYTIPLGKTNRLLVLMLPNAFNKVGSHSSIESAISATGEQINTRLFHAESLLD